MPYARMDDRYDDHRKIKRALRREPAAVAMHAMAITYCNRHNSDGEVDLDWIEEKLALMPYKPAQRARVLAVLVDLNLFERVDADTFLVHDFLDWNLSSEQRAKLAEQGRRGGSRPRGSSPTTPRGSSQPASPGLSNGSSQGLSEGPSPGSSPSGVTGLSTPSPRHATPTPTPSQEEKTPMSTLRADVAECFAYWQEKCGHPAAKLTADRRRKIEARHKEGYTVMQIRQAIEGAAVGAFVNDQGKRFDDIELICRNGSKLESFIERADAKQSTGQGGKLIDASSRFSEYDRAAGL